MSQRHDDNTDVRLVTVMTTFNFQKGEIQQEPGQAVPAKILHLYSYSLIPTIRSAFLFASMMSD